MEKNNYQQFESTDDPYFRKLNVYILENEKYEFKGKFNEETDDSYVFKDESATSVIDSIHKISKNTTFFYNKEDKIRVVNMEHNRRMAKEAREAREAEEADKKAKEAKEAREAEEAKEAREAEEADKKAKDAMLARIARRRFKMESEKERLQEAEKKNEGGRRTD